MNYILVALHALLDQCQQDASLVPVELHKTLHKTNEAIWRHLKKEEKERANKRKFPIFKRGKIITHPRGIKAWAVVVESTERWLKYDDGDLGDSTVKIIHADSATEEEYRRVKNSRKR